MMEISDQLVFWIVVAVRFLLPLTIPRYPLLGIVACMIVDAVDQMIFQQFTDLPLEGYQNYDKALDIYYLTIAYISTLRNWPDHFAFKLGRSLFYYRLVGVALFELTLQRPLLLVFPNVFEYFFIFYEATRLRWDPERLTGLRLIAAAAFILLVIKLPQEYWIHIAEMNTVDWIISNPWGILVLFAWAAVIVMGLYQVIRGVAPAPERTSIFGDHKHASTAQGPSIEDEGQQPKRLIDWEVMEKIALISLLIIIFAQILPEVRASNLALFVGVAVIIVINTLVSHWLVRRGTEWSSILKEFVVISAMNLGIVLAAAFLLPSVDWSINLRNTLFMVLLLTLNITLYDRYRRIHNQHFNGGSRQT
ncbi:hypothetical protein [Candidatus Methanocrinis natronophilus]|uniref:CDP-alcohol phosphatidyltransferase family protein n=1 Tax=Candidatus Methanocrinis natronophilus TaxID=3033396 RepID=A0ABT5XAJ6_9EURY|nr:hypothetical protein [Candidatus Methanocrinis natronophilus]MDF0591696.1 hypothetical protein [Candidatus Methanocrinis natronophilus]